MTSRTNPVDHPVHDLIRDRWSPYAFDPRPLPAGTLRSLFEAARWAASSFNEQPWRYLVAERTDEAEFARLMSCLMEGNQEWARNASALVITVARQTFTRNDAPNAMARHDVGQASALLTVEATHRGLVVHQMGGIFPDRARELYGIPEGYEAVTALAIGYEGEPGMVSEELQARQSGPRTRRPHAEFVFSGAWEKPASFE